MPAPPIGSQPSAYSATCANSVGPGAAADQHRRARLLHGLRPLPARLEAHELALEARHLVRPERLHREHRLAHARAAALAGRCRGPPSPRGSSRSRCRARSARPRAGRASRSAWRARSGRAARRARRRCRGGSATSRAAAAASATSGSRLRLYSSASSASPVGGGRAPAHRDVRVLGHVERMEAARLGLARELDGAHREVGRVDRDAELHGGSLRSSTSPVPAGARTRSRGAALASGNETCFISESARPAPETPLSATPFDRAYRLEDRYTRRARPRLPDRRAGARAPAARSSAARDLAAGLRTAGFISGYRGSPLGTYDLALWQARELLDAHHVRFEPGVNEDLAATAVWGSQQANLLPGPKYDGVFGIWYGKGPGVDRSCDALKHGNYAGTAPHGGVLVLTRRRPGREVLVDRAPERARADPLRHPGAEPVERAGVPRPRPRRLRALALLGLLGRLQVPDRHRGQRGLGRGRARARALRRARGLRARGPASTSAGRTTRSRWRRASTSSGSPRRRPSCARTGSTAWCSTRRGAGSAS